MGLRVHFTAEDLSRVQMARGPDPMWEIVLSVIRLTGAEGRVVFDSWRAQAGVRLRRLPGSHVRLIRHLAPSAGDFPDFLTPPQAAPGLAAGIETVLSTPRRQLRQDLARHRNTVIHTLTPLGAEVLAANPRCGVAP